ncbi:hypothetical protein EDB19DRAFT_1756399 [Suillus lakei]|nr:hypothetical protein EDB19DRAFT_1756399 [Suillus lakei]
MAIAQTALSYLPVLPFALIFTDIFRILQPGLSLKSCTTLFAFNTYVGGIILFFAECYNALFL